MFRVDAVMAIDANYQPQSRDTHDLRPEANHNLNPNRSFDDYLNSHLRSTTASSQAQMTNSHAASFLAWYYPPMMMISPKVEEKPKSSAE